MNVFLFSSGCTFFEYTLPFNDFFCLKLHLLDLFNKRIKHVSNFIVDICEKNYLELNLEALNKIISFGISWYNSQLNIIFQIARKLLGGTLAVRVQNLIFYAHFPYIS